MPNPPTLQRRRRARSLYVMGGLWSRPGPDPVPTVPSAAARGTGRYPVTNYEQMPPPSLGYPTSAGAHPTAVPPTVRGAHRPTASAPPPLAHGDASPTSSDGLRKRRPDLYDRAGAFVTLSSNYRLVPAFAGASSPDTSAAVATGFRLLMATAPTTTTAATTAIVTRNAVFASGPVL